MIENKARSLFSSTPISLSLSIDTDIEITASDLTVLIIYAMTYLRFLYMLLCMGSEPSLCLPLSSLTSRGRSSLFS